MKRELKTALIIAIILVAFSCEKDSINPSIPAINSPMNFLKEVKSDDRRTSEFFISGEFNGIHINCASTFANIYPDNNQNFNALYVNSNGLDQINLIRENNDMSVMIAIYFLQAKIFTRQIPYKLPHENTADGEFADIQLINMKKIGSATQNSMEDDFSFFGLSPNSIKIQVTSFVDNLMEGTFEGYLATRNRNSIIEVKNGKFRIKIKVVNLD
jgi:hypothetical protein